MRFCQVVIGPAGSGKSTYCSAMVKHGEVCGRKIHVINLDPAAEHFDYTPVVDIRQLIDFSEAMEDMGPNGALVYCMEQFVENLDWLQDAVEEGSEEYILFDIPGQIELFTHYNIIARLIHFLTDSLQFRVVGVFLLDSQFITDIAKFLSGSLVSLSAMINLEIPFINLLTKVDLLNSQQRKDIESFFEFGPEIINDDTYLNSDWAKKYRNLTRAIGTIVSKLFPHKQHLQGNHLFDHLIFLARGI